MKLARLLRVWLPLAAVAVYFTLRLPTQADAAPTEVLAAFAAMPALLMLAAWSAQELYFRPAGEKVRAAIADVVEGATEPVLFTHEFHPAHDGCVWSPDLPHPVFYQSGRRMSQARKSALYQSVSLSSFSPVGGKHRLTEQLPRVTEVP